MATSPYVLSTILELLIPILLDYSLKLSEYGISGCLLKFLEAFSDGGTQKVLVNGSFPTATCS